MIVAKDLHFTIITMFAVEGWKLGPLVAQTLPKKKLKRKREDAEEQKPNVKAKPAPRTNPFAMKNADSRNLPSTTNSITTASKEPKAQSDVKPKTKTSKDQVTLAKKERRREAKSQKRHQRKLQAEAESDQQDAPKENRQPSPLATLPTLTPLQQKMRAKLSGSQFRHINEKLYTTHSSEALNLFTEQPSLFHDVSALDRGCANDSITKVFDIKFNRGQEIQSINSLRYSQRKILGPSS